jgi:hypothetical protein
MLARETTVEEIPMISGVVILAKISHKRYPEMNPMTVSIKIYPAPLPKACPFNRFNLHLIRLTVYKYAILKIANL